MNELKLDTEEAQLLPEREALGVWDWANVLASNSSLALNAGSLNSTANAGATQLISVTQS